MQVRNRFDICGFSCAVGQWFYSESVRMKSHRGTECLLRPECVCVIVKSMHAWRVIMGPLSGLSWDLGEHCRCQQLPQQELRETTHKTDFLLSSARWHILPGFAAEQFYWAHIAFLTTVNGKDLRVHDSRVCLFCERRRPHNVPNFQNFKWGHWQICICIWKSQDDHTKTILCVTRGSSFVLVKRKNTFCRARHLMWKTAADEAKKM